MSKLSVLSVAILALLVVTLAVTLQGGANAATMVLKSDFETDPAAAGWVAAPNKDVAPLWVNKPGHSGQHYLEMSAGKWETPAFPVQPYTFYRAEFWYQGVGQNHVVAFSYEPGATSYLPADNYTSLPATGPWTRYSFVFRACNKAATAKVVFMSGYAGEGAKLLRVDDVEISELTDAEALAEADAMWAAMPPMTWTPPQVRLTRLPRTMAKLRAGQTVQFVMLGDSIINDTSNGPFDLFIERLYPGANVQPQISVRGSTGCWYYQDPVQLKAYVLDYQPDLVWIGGISQKNDIDAIQSVIRQTRAALPQVEFMLSSNSCAQFGDPKGNPEWSSVTDPHGDNYRSRLYRLAQAENVEYMDMSSAWGWYMLHQDKPYATYMRDPIHANDAGRMVLSRAIEAYFRP